MVAGGASGRLKVGVSADSEFGCDLRLNYKGDGEVGKANVHTDIERFFRKKWRETRKYIMRIYACIQTRTAQTSIWPPEKKR